MANVLLKAALAYAKQGWPIFPCRADKTPYTMHGFHDASTNKKKIEEWWNTWPNANIGFSPSEADLMVIDFDPGADEDQLERNIGELSSTKLIVGTPRQGQHRYYSIDPSETVSASTSKLAEHIDVRSFGSYVLLPPSKTADGSYEWLSIGKAAFRTDALIKAANQARRKSKDRDEWIIEPDLPENVDAAIKWLKHDARIAVEHQGGDHMAYATAAHLKSYGISQPLALDLMWEHWNPRCDPPWPSHEFDHFEQKIINGYSYNTSPPGNITPAFKVAKHRQLFKPVETKTEDGSQLQIGRFRFTDRNAFDLIKPPDWLIKDTIPIDGYAILFGPASSYKTFLAIDIACSIAADISKNHKIVTPGPVLFIAGEGRSNFPKRVKAWELYHNETISTDDLVLVDPVPLISEDLGQFIDGALQKSKDGYALTIIDTIGRSMQGVNENSQEFASKFTNLVQQLQYEFNSAVLAIHHTGHQDDQRTRGSSVFQADADTIIKAQKEQSFLHLHMLKQKDASPWDHKRTLIVRAVEQLNTLVIDTPTKDEKPSTTQQKTETFLAIVDRIAVEVLERNKSKAYKQSDLIDLVQDHDDFEGSKQTARNYIEKAKFDKHCRLRQHFDVNRSRFQGQFMWNARLGEDN